MNKYINYILNFNEYLTFSIINIFVFFLDAIKEKIFFLIKILCIIFEILIQAICIIFLKIYAIMRYSTIPYNWIIIRTWLWNLFRGGHSTPLDIVGVHYIQAPPGGGKSLLLKVLSDQVNQEKKKGVYLTKAIEKPKIDENGNKYVYNRFIDIKSYFDLNPDSKTAGQPIKRFNFNKYIQLFFDEFHLDNNNRDNKTKLYNLFFKPLLEQFISMRHDGCERIILTSQVASNDIQLMPMLARYHTLRLKKGIKWSEWMETGKFIYRPLKFRIKSFIIDPFNPDKKTLERIWNLSITLKNLEDFDSYAMRGSKNNLPLDFN